MIRVSRRSLLGAGLVLVTASAVPFAVPTRKTRILAARDFHDAIGICTHPNWRSRLWGRSDWESALIDTGVKNVRGKIGSGDVGRAALNDLQTLFRQGVKICATVADADLDRGSTKANLEFLGGEVGARELSGIESANEFNKPSSRPSDWAAQLSDFQRWLFETVQSDPRLASVPVIGPSIWGRLSADYAALGNLEPHIDRANLHYYTGGRRPTRAGQPKIGNEGGGGGDYGLSEAIREARSLAPGKPLWITEYGYPVAGPDLPLSRGFITESAAAKYLVRGLFDAFSEGVEKIFIYSLLDDVHRSPPRYHGLMDGSFRRRPAYQAVKNLMSLFSESGDSARMQTLDHSLGQAGSSIRHQLFRKADGTFLLAIYQDVDSYNRGAREDIDVQPVNVRLSLARPARKIELFTPTIDSAGRDAGTNIGTIDIPVVDHVTVVRITPA